MAANAEEEQKKQSNQRWWIGGSVVAAVLILLTGYAIFNLPLERILVVFILLPIVIAVIALVIGALAIILIPQIKNLRNKGENGFSPTRSDNDSSLVITSLARLIVLFTIVSITTLGFLIVHTAADTDKSRSASDFLATVLPLFGSWVGTVLAFYYGRANFEAGANASRPQTVNERLSATSARERMIHVNKIFKLVRDDNEDETLESILERLKDDAGKAGEERWSRIPVFNRDGSPLCVIHTSTIDRYRVDVALKKEKSTNKEVSELTLKDLLASDTGQKLISSSFGVVSDRASLADVQEKMAGATYQDVFVTENGSRNAPVLGWITNGIIEQAIKV